VPLTPGNFPLVRTITQMVRGLLADELVAPGFPFVPLSVQAASVGGHVICTANFPTNPGFVPNDTLLVAGMTPSNFNGTFSVTTSGTQVSWQNDAATVGTASVLGTIQGYGTGKKYTDTLLMTYVNSAYRALQRALKAAGSVELRVGTAFVTIPGLTETDPSATVYLSFEGLSIESDANPPPEFDIANPVGQLPSDLIMPRLVKERRTGSSDIFIEVVDQTNTGNFQLRNQGFNLAQWKWEDDSIVLIGAQQDNDIAIEYDRGLPALADGTSQIQILNCEDYLAFETSALVSPGRGGANGATWQAKSDDAKDKLIAATVRQQQFVSRRPRPFSSRRGYSRRALF